MRRLFEELVIQAASRWDDITHFPVKNKGQHSYAPFHRILSDTNIGHLDWGFVNVVDPRIEKVIDGTYENDLEICVDAPMIWRHEAADFEKPQRPSQGIKLGSKS